MTCVDLDRCLSEGVEDLRAHPDLQSHVESCERCTRRLASAERIRVMIHQDLKPVRPLPPVWVSVLALFGLTAIIVAGHSASVGAAGLAALSPAQLLVLTLWAVAVIVAGAVSLEASIRPASRPSIPFWLPVFLLGAGFPAMAGALFPSGPVEDFISHGVRCLSGGLMIAALAGAVAYAFARRGYATDWLRTGLLIGAAGAAVASIALLFSCSSQESGHMAVWHGLIILISITAGYLFGRRLENA